MKKFFKRLRNDKLDFGDALMVVLFCLLSLGIVLITRLSDLKNDAETALGLLGIYGALFAFFVGLIQYRNGQAWKKTEFLAQEYREFIANRYVQRAMHILDYPFSDFSLFDDELIEVEGGNPGYFISPVERKVVVKCNFSIVADALGEKYDDEKQSEFDSIKNIIRFSFDKFLFKLGLFHKHIASGLIRADDVKPYLHYWICVLKNTESPMFKTNNKESYTAMKKSLIGFMYRYRTDYDSLDQLLCEFGTENIETLDRAHGIIGKHANYSGETEQKTPNPGLLS